MTAGTRIYYKGDMANQPGEGRITRIKEPTEYSPMLYVYRLDDGRHGSVTANDFMPGIGCRFFTLEAYKTEREKSFAAFMAKIGA